MRGFQEQQDRSRSAVLILQLAAIGTPARADLANDIRPLYRSGKPSLCFQGPR